jgi:hypothetical protein
LSEQPVPETRLSRGAGNSVVSYLALLPMGFSVPSGSLPKRWALTPPFHPYRNARAPRRYILCGTVRRRSLAPRPRLSHPNKHGLHGIAPYGVRTFLPEPRPGAILRPSRIDLECSRRGCEIQGAVFVKFACIWSFCCQLPPDAVANARLQWIERGDSKRYAGSGLTTSLGR